MEPFNVGRFLSSCAVLSVCFALSACDGATKTKPPSQSSTIIYLVKDVKGSQNPNVPIYHLMTAGAENPQPREIAKLGAVNYTFSVDPDHRRIGLVTDYTDNPELLLVDIESGIVSNTSDSQGGDDSVALGPRDSIAFCDSKGQFKVGTVEKIAQSTTRAPPPSAGLPRCELAK